MSNSDDPDIYYLDAGSQTPKCYVPDSDSILLDEKLKEYPLAHSLVLNHEFGHHENRDSIVDDLLYEFKHDIRLAFSMSPAMEQFREYQEARKSGTAGKKRIFRLVLQNHLRSLWILLIYPSGKAYRYLKQRRSGVQKKIEGDTAGD